MRCSIKKTFLLFTAGLLCLSFLSCAKKAAPAQPQTEEKAAVSAPSFTVFCHTEEGSPLPGTGIQVCDGSLCRMLTTDAHGLVTYYGMPGHTYDVTPIPAPEGYRFISDRAVIADRAEQKIEFLLEQEKK